MLRLLPMSRAHGFTLVELMIAITVIGLLLVLAMPGYRAWIQNTQIRTAAESIQNGMQRARAEAVRRNTRVAFILDPATTGSSWQVVVVTGGEVVEARAAGEGSANVSRTVQPGGATTVTFGSLGTVVTNSPASASLASVELDSTVLDATESRELRVTIGAGGNVRMCDPQLTTGADPRAC